MPRSRKKHDVKKVGSRLEVFKGLAKRTSKRETKRDLMRNSSGQVVSKKEWRQKKKESKKRGRSSKKKKRHHRSRSRKRRRKVDDDGGGDDGGNKAKSGARGKSAFRKDAEREHVARKDLRPDDPSRVLKPEHERERAPDPLGRDDDEKGPHPDELTF